VTPTGKFAFFKAIVNGEPKPTVTWSRNNGDVSDPARYQTKYDPVTDEHTFEVSDRVYRVSLRRHMACGTVVGIKENKYSSVRSRWRSTRVRNPA
jgi:hypothetical protein